VLCAGHGGLERRGRPPAIAPGWRSGRAPCHILVRALRDRGTCALRTVLAAVRAPARRNDPGVTQKPLRVLIIDKSAVRAAILEEGLRDCSAAGLPLVVHRISNEPLDLLPRIASVDPDVVLIDLENPSRDTLEQMFQVSRLAKRPIAMFVDQSDSQTVQEAIDAGVSAYVVDGLRRERVKSILDVTISRFRAFDRLQRELSEAKSALEDRKVVEQAKAILMKQRRIDEARAYALLRRTAMNQNRKLADLARSLVAAAALLATGEPDD
jgi:response regulator NasT